MATRAPFLTTRFGGYYHRDVPEEDTNSRTSALARRAANISAAIWQPICFADELQGPTAAGQDPRRRSRGLPRLERRSRAAGVALPHRGTSLEFGLVCDQGIRCCYHGWLFAVDGTILETPGEPAESTLKDRLCHGAYPTHEYNGIVFAYMGPPDKQPPFPMYDSFTRPGYRLIPGRNISIRATGCRSWKTPWTPCIRRFSTPSSAAPSLPTSSGSCRSWSLPRLLSG